MTDVTGSVLVIGSVNHLILKISVWYPEGLVFKLKIYAGIFYILPIFMFLFGKRKKNMDYINKCVCN